MTPEEQKISQEVNNHQTINFSKIASKVALYNKGEPLVQIAMVDHGRDKKFSILSADSKSVTSQGSNPSSAIDKYSKNTNAVR